MEIKIVKSEEELKRVHQLRYQCYIEELRWNYPQADLRTKELGDPMDQFGMIYYAEDAGRVVATYCIHFGGGFELPGQWRKQYALDRFAEFPETNFSFSSRLMVLPELRGSTIVARILMRAYEEAWKRGIRFNFCWCRPRLVSLYEQLGFIRYKDNFLDSSQGYVVPMVLMVEDPQHLNAVRSPFQKICRAHRPSTETAEWFDRTFPGIRAAATRQLCSPDEFWQHWAAATDAENVALFQGLTAEQVRALLDAGVVLQCRAGDRLIREGEAGDEAFLVLSGTVRIYRKNDHGGEHLIGLQSEGEVFGELALVSRTLRTATVEAVTDAQLLVITKDFLLRAMKNQPDIASRLLFNLSGVLCLKLKETTQRWHAGLNVKSSM